MPDELLVKVRNLEEYSEVGSKYNLFIGKDGYGNGTDYYVYFLNADVGLYCYRYRQEIRFTGSYGVRYSYCF